MESWCWIVENRNMQMAYRIAEKVAEQGGRTFFVGGFVRDRLRGNDNKDIDIEIHGILPEVLEQILNSLGKMTEMGASFGIFGLKGYDLDIAMPRKEEATGRGHKDFTVYVDPFLGTYKAALRRDFTMNALMQDVLTDEVVDHFGGIADMEKGVLRHVNQDTFVEDPLRVLRAAQFAARFGFQVAPETVELAKTMDLTALARERILGELEKALLKSDTPSVFFEEMVKMEQMEDWFPEIAMMRGEKTKQGTNLWTYTMQVLDMAAEYRDQLDEPLQFMLLALTHALPSEKIRKTFLERVTNENKVIKYVGNMAPLYQEPKKLFLGQVKEVLTTTLFDKALAPKELALLAVIVDCVESGSMKVELDEQACQEESDFQSNEQFARFLQERVIVFQRVMAKPFVMGADLIHAGMKPGKSFSQILAYAHQLRLAEVDKEDALAQTLTYAKEKNL